MARGLPLLWHGPFREPTGYADEGRAFLLSLERSGYTVAAREAPWLGADPCLPPSHVAAIDRACARPVPDGDVLLAAWADAFGPDEDVCLVLKCLSLNDAARPLAERVAELAGPRPTAPVVLLERLMGAAEMPSLYAAADAYVMASRGEGWGRPYMEAMAMGLPTIGSRWSGNLMFMHDANAWLVDGRVVEVAEGAQAHAAALYRGHRWFEPDRDALADALREVASGATKAPARPELLSRFGPEPVAARVAELTEAALERARWRRSRPVACVWRGDWGSI